MTSRASIAACAVDDPFQEDQNLYETRGSSLPYRSFCAACVGTEPEEAGRTAWNTPASRFD
jgi:hypothetical protein